MLYMRKERKCRVESVYKARVKQHMTSKYILLLSTSDAGGESCLLAPITGFLN